MSHTTDSDGTITRYYHLRFNDGSFCKIRADRISADLSLGNAKLTLNGQLVGEYLLVSGYHLEEEKIPKSSGG